jgi:hypothetical protein
MEIAGKELSLINSGTTVRCAVFFFSAADFKTIPEKHHACMRMRPAGIQIYLKTPGKPV